MRASCAGCHGAAGRGRSTDPFVSPDISYRTFTDPAGLREPGGARGATDIDDLIGRAIAGGLDAEGKPLAWPMSRWQLSDQEVADLPAYRRMLL